MKSSRRTRIRDKKLAARTTWLIFLIIVFLSILFVAGPPLLIQFSLLVGNSPHQTQKEQNKETVLLPPSLDLQPMATNSATLIIKGRGQSGTTVIVNRNGKRIGKTLVDKDGIFTVGKINLTEGNNTFRAKTVENGTESKESVKLSVLYKPNPPILEINSPKSDSVFREEQNEINVEGKTEEDVKLTINDRIVPVGINGLFSFPMKLNEGENTIHVKVQDVAGNETTEELTVTYQP